MIAPIHDDPDSRWLGTNKSAPRSGPPNSRRNALRHTRWPGRPLARSASRTLMEGGPMTLWWRRRESNPRPKPPRKGFYACSRRLVFVAGLARRPAWSALRRHKSRLGVNVRTLRPAHFRTFDPASHGRGFRGTLTAIKQLVRSCCCQLWLLQFVDAANCIRDARPLPWTGTVETVSPPWRTDQHATLVPGVR